MQKYFIHVGEQYGYLTVLEVGVKEYLKPVMHKCICKCGNITYAESWSLKKGDKKSCGCLQKEATRANAIHGACRNKNQTGLYRSYRKMLARCYNKRQKCYPRYGGRGITVCEEWRKGFIYFKEWAYSKGGYSEEIKHLTIDRIDNDGNYEPDNCQFLTNSENVKKQWEELHRKGLRNYVNDTPYSENENEKNKNNKGTRRGKQSNPRT